MPRCTRRGCGKYYTDDNMETCTYHPGAPVFHEGLKSWSCCSDVNKPVLDFDDFMRLPGCSQERRHTHETSTDPVDAKVPATRVKAVEETKTTGPSSSELKPTPNGPVAPPVYQRRATQDPTPATVLEDEDDPSIPVDPGTKCKRRGCGVQFVNDEMNRQGDGEGTACSYHPGVPIFREGSKGYLCCKRRVLEFDEFLKIKGCKVGRHVFTVRARGAKELTPKEEKVTCRLDHYQTEKEVYVCVYAVKVAEERSTIEFREDEVYLDLTFGTKRFERLLKLFGTIDPVQSSFSVMNTKVELRLVKRDTRVWTLLERTNQDLGSIRYTFGVTGRTGTVGAKEIVS